MARSGDVTELTLNADSEDALHSGGSIHIYWGTGALGINPYITGHPSYRGLCYLVFKSLQFGQGRTSAPNVEVIVSRKPVVDSSLIFAADNVLSDDQANPVAVLAELVTSAHGLGLPVSKLANTDWQTAAAWCNASDARRAMTFCSPLITSQSDARTIIPTLLDMFDGVLFWNEQGLLGIKLIQPGVDPGGLTTLDATLITDKPHMDCPGFGDVPSTVMVRYYDRDHSYKERQVVSDNQLALRLRGFPKVSTIQRPHITRADQASLHASEQMRRQARPVGSIELSVRRPFAAGLLPGSRVKADVDPEPGGGAAAQLCVVQERRENSTGPVTLTLRPDTLVPATPYSPQWTAPSPDTPFCAAIDPAQTVAVPLPTAIWDTPSVGVLSPRPSADVTGFRVFFAVDSDADGDLNDEAWAELGVQTGFACRMTVVNAATDGDGTLRLSLADPSTPDAYLCGRFPGTEIGALADTLLVVLANLDTNGQVVTTDGVPEMECCSVVTRVAVDSTTHDYTVLRARLNLPARSWATTARAFIVPLASLVPWTHPTLAALLSTGGAGYLRLVAYNVAASDASTPIPQVSFGLPAAYNPAPVVTWTDPSTNPAATDGSGDLLVTIAVTDRDGDLVSVRVDSVKTDGTDAVARTSVALGLVDRWDYTATLNFDEGTHNLTVTATDAAGHVTVSTRTVTRTPAGGLTPPTFSPGDTSFTSSLTVTVTGTSPADQLQWMIASTLPTSGWTETAVGTLTAVVGISSTCRLWARSKKSSDSSLSDWVSAYYSKDFRPPGGTYLP